MKNNFIAVDGKVYKQETGTATGTAVAPAFASLYMYFKFQPPFKRFSNRIIFQSRYIDEGFVILNCIFSVSWVMAFLNACTNLKLTHQYSFERAMYLDVEIYNGERFRRENRYDLVVYTKPISKFLYLLGKSYRSDHDFTRTVKGEMIRFIRNTNSKEIWERKVAFLFGKLLRRSYSGKHLGEAIPFVSYIDQEKSPYGTGNKEEFNP